METLSHVVEQWMPIDTKGGVRELKHQSEAIKLTIAEKNHIIFTGADQWLQRRIFVIVKKTFFSFDFGTLKQGAGVLTLGFFERSGGCKGSISAWLLLNLALKAAGMFLQTVR